MKNSKPTFQVAFAVMLVLVLTLFPHHHHDGGAACWVEEICHTDGQLNDEHTAHGAAGHGEGNACHWQPMPPAKFQARSASWDAADGLPPCLPGEFFTCPTPYIYTLRGAAAFVPPPAACACPDGKHFLRRGPPVCQS